MPLNANVHEKCLETNIPLYFICCRASWCLLAVSPLGSRRVKETQKVPKFLRFQESEDSQQCEGITLHLISVPPISGQWGRCRLKTVSTSQISPTKLQALPLGRSLLLQLWAHSWHVVAAVGVNSMLVAPPTSIKEREGYPGADTLLSCSAHTGEHWEIWLKACDIRRLRSDSSAW